MHQAVRVYVLHLEGVGALTLAFDRVLDCEEVASCSIEPNDLRLRFVAPAKPAQRLVERIYLEGGLLWCSRHDLAETR